MNQAEARHLLDRPARGDWAFRLGAIRPNATATGQRRLSLALIAVIAAAAWLASWAMDNASFGTVAGSTIGIVLAVASVPIGRRLGRRETDPLVRRLLVIAPVLKLGMSVVRYAVAFVVYDGSADAAVYHNEGIRLSALYAEGIFNADLGRAFVGTGFVRMLTGLLYTATGPTMLGAFFVFSWAGFWGLYLFYRGFCIAVPHGDHRRYALLVLLLPSLLFWPSSLGKEALMCLGLGLSAYGAAAIFTRLRFGFILMISGLALMGAVRPHVAAMLAVATGAAYITRRTPAGASITAPLGKLVGLVVLGLVLVIAIGETQSLLGIDQFNTEAVETARTEVVDRTNQGGSNFQNEETDLDPSEFHIAVASVLFRPFPWEAHNLQAMIASVEGLLLLGLFLAGWRRLLTAVRSILRTPYVVMCITYSVLFIYGFSSFTNFGILTRQRVQVLPFVLVLICLPPYKPRGQGGWRTFLTEATESRANTAHAAG